MDELKEKNQAEILWENIQLSYTAILRAQKIMFVADKNGMIKEIKKIKKKTGARDTGEMEMEWEFQFAWNRQAAFLTAQARAMSELRSLIRQYEEIANEKQKVDVKKIKAETERLKDSTGGNSKADDWVAAMMGEISENESEEDFQCVYTLGSGQPM